VDHEDGPFPLPAFVRYPIFPFEGDLRTKPLEPPEAADWPRSGEPGGRPCESCAAADDEYVWVDDRWRVRAARQPTGVPVQLFLETRAHVDLDGLDAVLTAELGGLLVRLDRAVRAVGGIGRVHLSRWGDGGSHFHMWCYGRPLGAMQLLGFCLPMWAMILPPTADDVWCRNLAVVAAELARDGGTAMASSPA
jgi:hypothetical protein